MLSLWTRFLIASYLRIIAILFVILFLLSILATLVKFGRIPHHTIPINAYLIMLCTQSLDISLHGIPFDLVLSTVILLTHLKNKNLLIILSFARRGPRHILAPLLGVAWCIGVVQVFIVSPIYTKAIYKNATLTSIYFQKSYKPVLLSSGYWIAKNNILMNIQSITKNQLSNIHVFIINHGIIQTIIHAKSGQIINHQYILQKNTIVNQNGTYEKLSQYTINMPLKEINNTNLLYRIFHNPYRSIYTLPGYIHSLKLLGFPYYKQAAELCFQITSPFFNVLFVLSSAIFVLKLTPRQKETLKIILSLITGFSLYTMLQIALNIAQSGQYNPVKMIFGILLLMGVLVGSIACFVIL